VSLLASALYNADSYSDIVDTVSSKGNLYKMLCGACDRWFDETEIETEDRNEHA
jgi:hypothetical protein